MPTALELTREEWLTYAQAAVGRELPPDLSPAQQRARERLLARVRKAAELLKTHFGVRHVILFGSLAHRGWFAADSDVDLVVEGLDADRYWQAWRQAEEIIADRSLDLIDIETASPSLLQSVQRHGVEL